MERVILITGFTGFMTEPVIDFTFFFFFLFQHMKSNHLSVWRRQIFIHLRFHYGEVGMIQLNSP